MFLFFKISSIQNLKKKISVEKSYSLNNTFQQSHPLKKQFDTLH